MLENNFIKNFLPQGGFISTNFKTIINECPYPGVQIKSNQKNSIVLAAVYGKVTYYSKDKGLVIVYPIYPSGHPDTVRIEYRGLSKVNVSVGEIGPWTILGHLDDKSLLDIRVIIGTSRKNCWNNLGYKDPKNIRFVNMETGENDFIADKIRYFDKFTQSGEGWISVQKYVEFNKVTLNSKIRHYLYQKDSSTGTVEEKWMLWEGQISEYSRRGREIKINFLEGNGKFRLKIGQKVIKEGKFTADPMQVDVFLADRNTLFVDNVDFSRKRKNIPNPPF